MGKSVGITWLFMFDPCTANNLLWIRDGVRFGLLFSKAFRQGQGGGVDICELEPNSSIEPMGAREAHHRLS